MTWLKDFFRQRMVLEIRRPTQVVEANEAFICTRMSSLRESENYKILQTLWATKRSKLVEKLKDAKDDAEAGKLAAELRGFDEAANVALTWARRDPEYKQKEREALARHHAKVKASLKGE